MRKISDVIIEADLTVDTNVLHVDSTNNRVGIGTASPSNDILHVAGNIMMDGSILRMASSTTKLVLQNVGGSWNSLSAKGINIGDWSTDPSYGDIRVGDYDFDVIRTDGTHLIKAKNNGNVLIGTTTDAGYKLDVAGNVRAVGTSHTLDAGAYEFNVVSSGLTATLGGSTGGDLGGKAATYHFGGTGAVLRVGPQYVSDRDYIEIAAGGTNSLLRTNNELLTVKNTGGHVILEPSGNVGIGTTTPAHKLDVAGGVFADYFQLDTAATPTPAQGMFYWDADEETAGLQVNGLNYELGQGLYWVAKNQTGSQIDKGTPVYASGTLGSSTRLLISPMIADGTIEAKYFLGIAAEDIADGTDGKVITQGKLRQLDTTGYGAAGNVLWVSASTAGQLTHTKPTGTGDIALAVAFVVDYASNGSVAVRVSNLDENIVGVIPTLDQVTTAGNTTTNNINTVDVIPTSDSVYDLGSSSNRYLYVYSRYLDSGANTLELRSGATTVFRNGGTERIRITSTGNLLIGTTTDGGEKLQVSGTARIEGDLSFSSQVGTWITSSAMADAIGWNASYGVYIGSNVGGTHYLRGNGTFTTGGSTYNLWHSGNDGSGSGLDADLLDGVNLAGTSNNGLTWDYVPRVKSDGVMEVGRYIDFHHTSNDGVDYATRLHTNGSSNGLLYINSSLIWTSSNDGAGSNLDADLLDGQQGSYYAPIASPALSGVPTAPTAAAGTNTTQIATTAFVGTAVSNLVDSAPTTLDTLNELAAALGDDPNFATTVTNSIATKLPLAGGTMTGTITTNSNIDFSTDSRGIEFYSTNSLKKMFGRGMVLEVDTGRAANSYLEILQSGTYYFFWNSNQFSTTDVSNWNTAYSWGDHGTAGYALSTDLAAYLPLTGGTLGGPLTINGNLTVNGTITENSSLRVKENIITSEGHLDKVNKLRPVKYNKIDSEKTEIGLIAEEVVEVYPEFIQYDENGDPAGIHYSRLTASLIGAVKELTKEVEELKNKING